MQKVFIKGHIGELKETRGMQRQFLKDFLKFFWKKNTQNLLLLKICNRISCSPLHLHVHTCTHSETFLSSPGQVNQFSCLMLENIC